MRLLNTHTGRLEEFNGSEIPTYAILSHRWGDDEQTFKEVEKLGRKLDTRARSVFHSLPSGLSAKLRGACKFAASRGYEWIWVDTCCIDKASSAELSEAINSMFAFYSNADVCIVYLADVPDNLPDPAKEGSAFWRSQWFTRGWTLQELIAPQKVLFVSRGWKAFGTKDKMAPALEAITGVNKEVLTFTRAVSSVSIAERMSWAAERVTTRVEDRAYSLLGLFGVYMPTLYGEDVHAFRRLQEELLRSSPDQSLFAWGFSSDPPLNKQIATIFADSPARYSKDDVQGMSTVTIEDIPKAIDAFRSAVTPTPSASLAQSNVAHPIEYDTPAYSITNYGIRARVPVVRRTTNTSLPAVMILATKHNSSYIGLVIHRLSWAATNHYAVGRRGYRLVRVGAPGTGEISPPEWAHDLDLVHDDVTVRWEDIYITATETWLAQIRPAVADMPLRMLSGVPASDLNYFRSEDHHSAVTRRWLFVMNTKLKQDLCGIGDPLLRNEDVPGLATRIADSIPEELRHACKLWLTHLPLSSPDVELLQELSTFVSDHLLHWVEALGVLGWLRVAMLGLPPIFDWLSTHAPAEEGVLRDVDRMIRANREIMETSSLQLYDTFDLPDCNLSRKLPTPKIKLLSPRRGWSALLGKMESDAEIIVSMAFMPDNVHIISGCLKGSVSMWNSRSLERITTFTGHHISVYAVACSSDGRLVASCGGPPEVALWDVGTGALLRVLAGEGDILLAVAFSADNLHIAAGSDNGSVRIWSVTTGEIIRTFTKHTASVGAVAFSSADGRVLASGSDDRTIKIWNIATGNVIRELKGHGDSVTSVSFSPNGSQIASGSQDGSARIWNAATGRIVRCIPGISDHVWFVAFVPHGSCIHSWSSDGIIRKWDIATGNCLSIFGSSQSVILSCSISQDGSRFASAALEGTIAIWDANSTRLVEHMHAVSAVDFSPDGKTFATSSRDGTVCLWKTSTPELLHTIPHDSSVCAVRFSPKGTVLATATGHYTIRMFEMDSWQEVGSMTWHQEHGEVWSLAFSMDGTQIACGTERFVAAWDVGSRERVAEFMVDHRVDVLAFSPDMTRIVTGLTRKDAGEANVWDVATGQCVAVLQGPPGLHSLGFSSDGARIVGRGYDGSVRVSTIPSALQDSSSMGLDEAPLRFSWKPDSCAVSPQSGGRIPMSPAMRGTVI